MSREGATIVEAVNTRIRENGISVEQLYVERGRTDDVFRQITSDGGAGDELFLRYRGGSLTPIFQRHSPMCSSSSSALAGRRRLFRQVFQRVRQTAAFFSFHPWLYLFLIPAVGMRLWAEERKSGTIELLMTLLSTTEAVLGKFVTAWFFTGIALLLTFPIWITVNYLGSPDNGVIFAGYVGSFLMAGAFLAIEFRIGANPQSNCYLRYFGCGMFFFMMSGLEPVQSAFRGWAALSWSTLWHLSVS